MNILDDMKELELIKDKLPYTNPCSNNTIDNGTWICPICGDVVSEMLNVCYHSTYISDKKK